MSLTELAAQDDNFLLFKFKYFQNFVGDIELPEEFSPESVTVEAAPEGKGAKRVTETVVWTRLFDQLPVDGKSG